MQIPHSFKKILILVFALITSFSFATAQVTVNVSSPASGATVSSSFTLYANASSPNGMSGWYIYVDNNAVWNTPGPTGSIAANLNLATGSHSITVRAWDKTGAYGSKSLSLTVSSTTSSSTSSSGVTVKVSTPTGGSSVGSPVSVSVSGSSPNGIAGWVVYMDNQNVYQVDNYSNSLNAQVSMPTGSHTLYIRAWDRVSGYGTSPNISINVGSSSTSTSSSGGILTPPSTATVITQIENTDTSTWGSCSNCAGGANNTSSFWTANWQSSPSIDGSSREFYVGGPAWTAALFWKKLGAHDSATHFIWDFWVYTNSSSLDNVWTFEFDLFQAIGGYEYMIGTHCSIGDGYWYGWNQATNRWVQFSSAPCKKSQWTPGVWHHVVWYMERIPNSHYYKYDGLVFDGAAYTINMSQPANYTGWADNLGVQWQVDTNGNGGDVHWWVDKVKLTYW
ncbi:MAG: Ig-like domain-containing protein [Terriglobales bacterium]